MSFEIFKRPGAGESKPDIAATHPTRDIISRICDAVYDFERVSDRARAKTIVLGREAWLELLAHPAWTRNLRAHSDSPLTFDGFAIFVEGEGNSVTARGSK